MHKQINSTKKLVVTAMLIAAGTILSLFKLFELPFGGTVTPGSMVPLILVSYIYGTRWGLFSGVMYGCLQLVCGMGTVAAFFLPGESSMTPAYAVIVCLMDYVLAYTALGFAGVFSKRTQSDSRSLVLGITFSIILRYVIHIVSGAIFFGVWAEWFFADSTGLSQIAFMKGFCTWVTQHVTGRALSILYSVIYNGAYMIPEYAVTVFAAPFVYKVLKRSGTLD